MDIEQEIKDAESTVEESKRSLAQAEGKMEVSTKNLTELETTFAKAPAVIKDLATKLDNLGPEIRKDMESLKDEYDWE